MSNKDFRKIRSGAARSPEASRPRLPASTVRSSARSVLLCCAGLLGVSLPACSSSPIGSEEEPTGKTLLQIRTPVSGCLSVLAESELRDVEAEFQVTEGVEEDHTMGGLPFTTLAITASLFDSAECEGVPLYVATTEVDLSPGSPTAYLTLDFLGNGQVVIDDATFEGQPEQSCEAPVNVALGADTSESDAGWGGGSYPAEMTDGIQCYPEWPHGLAFTGGTGNWAGQSCGWRQATVSFGSDRQLTGIVRLFHHGGEHIPNTVAIDIFTDGEWQEVFATDEGASYTLPDTCPVGATPGEYDIGPNTASKVRFWLNNCDITHGWIYEMEVEGCAALP